MIFALLFLGACAAVRYDAFLSDWKGENAAFLNELGNGTVPFPTAGGVFFDDGSPAPSLQLSLGGFVVGLSAVPIGSVGVSMFVLPSFGFVGDRPLFQLSGSGAAFISFLYDDAVGLVFFKTGNTTIGTVPTSSWTTAFNHVFIVLNASGSVQFLTVNDIPVGSNAPRSRWTGASMLLPRIAIGGGANNTMLIDNVCVFATDATENLDAIRLALNRGQRPPTPRPPMTAPPTPAIAPTATPGPPTPTPTPRPTPASPPPRPIPVPTPQPTPAPPTPRPAPTPESLIAPTTSVTQAISDAVPLQTTTIGATSTSLLATASNTSESASIVASSAAVAATGPDAALIGGAAGGAAAVLLAGGIVFCVCRARRAQRRGRPAGDVAAASSNELRQSNYGAAGLAVANVYDVGNVAASNEYGRVGAAAEPRYSSPAVLQQQQATGIQAKQTGVGTEYSSL